MKRAVWAAVGMIVVVGVVGLWQPWDAATAQEDRSVHIWVLENGRPNVGGIADDDSCVFTHATPDGITVPTKLVIRNEVNAIIAVQEVPGTFRVDEGDTDADCVADLTVTVPQAAFYRVEWGDAVIATLTDSDTLEDDVVLIEFSSPTS